MLEQRAKTSPHLVHNSVHAAMDRSNSIHKRPSGDGFGARGPISIGNHFHQRMHKALKQSTVQELQRLDVVVPDTNTSYSARPRCPKHHYNTNPEPNEGPRKSIHVGWVRRPYPRLLPPLFLRSFLRSKEDNNRFVAAQFTSSYTLLLFNELVNEFFLTFSFKCPPSLTSFEIRES